MVKLPKEVCTRCKASERRLADARALLPKMAKLGVDVEPIEQAIQELEGYFQTVRQEFPESFTDV